MACVFERKLERIQFNARAAHLERLYKRLEDEQRAEEMTSQEFLTLANKRSKWEKDLASVDVAKSKMQTELLIQRARNADLQMSCRDASECRPRSMPQRGAEVK